MLIPCNIGSTMRTARAKVREAAKADRSEEIISIAMDLFGRHGYEGVGLRDIAEQCDMHVSTLYHYFGGKAELYSAVVKRSFEKAAANTFALASQQNGAEDPITRYITGTIDYLFSRPVEMRVIEAELHQGQLAGSDVISQEVIADTTNSTEEIARLIKRTNSPLLKKFSPDQVADILYSLIYGMVIMAPIRKKMGRPESATSANIKRDLMFLAQSILKL